ncbi:MAG: transcriptional repressor [Pseudomonadales bacterium]|nr:transcriptional repressor [Pseudomonadales bacterium]MBO6655401.1 transcriptional repressor [Pseudomonadales bacterium]MBO6701175.1 transcriptional repressor [Pseudomonadales bacterium]MBO7004978.1 transcriptional repressor [Pseudomonadales bacterium]
MNQDPVFSTSEILDRAENYCKSRGTRLTDKRKKVLKGLVDSKKAMSAYELADYCRDELDFQLPPMSVYRILDFLESEHLVHRLDLAKKYVACSHITCDHQHEQPQFLICKGCYRVREISIKRGLMNSLNESVAKVGFSLASQQLEFDCLCGDCSG